MIRITAKRNGFRRCGIEHSSSPTEYPNSRFTEQELNRLQAEPMLVVQILADPEESVPSSDKSGEGTPADLEGLRKQAKELGIPRAGQLGEAKLIEAIQQAESAIIVSEDAGKADEQ